MRRAVAVFALVAAPACEAPSRPVAPGPDDQTIDLAVEVVSPLSDQTILAGRVLAITIRARESLGRVDGIGYVTRRAAHGGAALDSVLIALGPIGDTTHTLLTLLPDTFTTAFQLDIYGLARAGQVLVRSDTRHLTALHCPPDASWC